MNRFLSLVLAFLALSCLARAPRADDSTRFTLVGAGTDTFPWVSSEPSTFSYSSKIGYGGGALLDLPVNAVDSLSLGVLYLDRAFSDGINSVNAYAVNVSALYRMGWGGFSLGGGAFYSIGTSLSENSSSSSYSAYGIKSSDWGVVGSAAMDLDPILIEARYMMDPENIAVGGNLKFRFQTVALMLGYRFGI